MLFVSVRRMAKGDTASLFVFVFVFVFLFSSSVFISAFESTLPVVNTHLHSTRRQAKPSDVENGAVQLAPAELRQSQQSAVAMSMAENRTEHHAVNQIDGEPTPHPTRQLIPLRNNPGQRRTLELTIDAPSCQKLNAAPSRMAQTGTTCQTDQSGFCSSDSSEASRRLAGACCTAHLCHPERIRQTLEKIADESVKWPGACFRSGRLFGCATG
jgi:hypothetical protein